MAEKEKREQLLKDTREARVKEYNEALDSLTALQTEIKKKNNKKIDDLIAELEKYDEELNASYKEQLKKTKEIIKKFEQDYPRGYNASIRICTPNSTFEKIFNDFLCDFHSPSPPAANCSTEYINPQHMAAVIRLSAAIK